MILSEKLSAISESELHLYKEGVFWVAYEQDAYRLGRIKRLQPTKKRVKALGREVVSVGFPSSALDGVLAHYTVKERSDYHLCLSGAEPVNDEAFTAWKSSLTLYTPPPAAGSPQAAAAKTDNSYLFIIDQLRHFSLESKTPLDCVLFLARLKEQILSVQSGKYAL
jgi:hypothetical protein